MATSDDSKTPVNMVYGRTCLRPPKVSDAVGYQDEFQGLYDLKMVEVLTRYIDPPHIFPSKGKDTRIQEYEGDLRLTLTTSACCMLWLDQNQLKTTPVRTVAGNQL